VLNRTLSIPTSKESSGVAAAYRVWLGRGIYPSLEALAELVPIVDRVAPNLDNQSIYRRQYSA